jgi:hypothetical protein
MRLWRVVFGVSPGTSTGCFSEAKRRERKFVSWIRCRDDNDSTRDACAPGAANRSGLAETIQLKWKGRSP